MRPICFRIVVPLLFATRVWGCVCTGVPESVRQSWERASVVFLGTVELADPDGSDGHTMFQTQRVRIRVDEAFKGVAAGQTIELTQGGDSCSAKFATAERAVFYLDRDDSSGKLFTGACARTRGSAETGSDDLLFLRGLPRSAVGTRLSGKVELYERSRTEGFRRVQAFANHKVRVIASDGVIREAVTNSAGVYEFRNLPPGKYAILTDTPKSTKLYFSTVSGAPTETRPKDNDTKSVVLKPNSQVGVGFVFMADTRLGGRMIDRNGAPKSKLCVDLEPLEGVADRGSRYFGCSRDDGAFKIDEMPPGKYLLAVHDEILLDSRTTRSTLYYPGMRDREKATAITVEAGKPVKGIEFRIPSDSKRHRLTGKVHFADGVPATQVEIVFKVGENGYTDTTKTSQDGSFALPVTAGMKGQLTARLAVMQPLLARCPGLKVGPEWRGIYRFIDAAPIPLSIDSDIEGLNIELPSPSCPLLQ